MRSIKWCHFQLPYTNPDPVFKVTPLFDAELTNSYRYGQKANRKPHMSFQNNSNGTSFNDLE